MSSEAKISLGSSKEGAARVLEALSQCQSFEDVERLGFLFHGTSKKIQGDLRGGGYDNVFWTAECPAVAQAYIPRSGSSSIVGRPSDWEMDSSFWPSLHDSPAMDWAMARANVTREDLDLKDDGQSVCSWRKPSGWPTNRDMVAWIEKDLGYEEWRPGCYKVMSAHVDGREVFRPADWSLQGMLVIALAPDLKIEEPQWSADALGYRMHNRVGDFMRFAEEGREAFSAEDSLQSDEWGNVGHMAIGVLPAGLPKLDWIAIPALRHDGLDVDWATARETTEFLQLMEQVAPDYTPAADNMPSAMP